MNRYIPTNELEMEIDNADGICYLLNLDIDVSRRKELDPNDKRNYQDQISKRLDYVVRKKLRGLLK